MNRIRVKQIKPLLFAASLFLWYIYFAPSAWAGEKNSLTFINRSGEDAMVKLVGPSRRMVNVNNGGETTVKIAGGTYAIYVRYGESNNYRYTKGETFTIKDSFNSYTEASLTLHGVMNGNYRTEGSTEEAFNGH